MVMGVDQAGQDGHAAGVDDSVGAGWQLSRRSYLFDDMVARQESAVNDATARSIHRNQQIGVFEQEGRHG